MKTIFNIIITISLISLGFILVPFLNDFLQTVITLFNTYLDGLFQFTQYFIGIENCEYLIIILVFVILTILISIFVK